PLPVGGAHRPLARRAGAGRDDLGGEAVGARARVVARPHLTRLGAAHARAEPGDPRAARAHRRVLAAHVSVPTLVAVGDDLEVGGDPDARYPIYSITKAAIAAAVLLLVREGAVALDSVRRLLDHTSGVRDYGSLPEYHEAVRTRPGSAWGD